jgi:hypothetical protein
MYAGLIGWSEGDLDVVRTGWLARGSVGVSIPVEVGVSVHPGS